MSTEKTQEFDLDTGAVAQSPRKPRAKVAKEDRYKWLKPDVAGEFEIMAVDRLEIDPTYQREERPSTVAEVARNFSWAAFGVLAVAERNTPEGKRYFVFDGQNRLAGVRKRSDITDVPCMIYRVEDVDGEAGAFLATNTNRRPVTALEKHRAKAITKAREAVVLEELVHGSGLRISPAAVPGTVRCVGLLEKLIKQDEDRLRKVWPLIVEVCKGHPVHERIVHALFYLAGATEGEMLKVYWQRKIVDIGYDELLKAAASAMSFYSKGGARVWAVGMLQKLNHGMRKNHLKIANDDLAQAA